MVRCGKSEFWNWNFNAKASKSLQRFCCVDATMILFIASWHRCNGIIVVLMLMVLMVLMVLFELVFVELAVVTFRRSYEQAVD